MRYILYSRKSTAEEDRQILSIESQLIELREFAKKENIAIIREFTESKTAKQPGREVFNEMLKLIEKGQADGIIAWHPDRLARNSVDGGKIIYLVDIGKIKDLKFPTYKFDNSAYGKFILTIAFGQSKYYVDNLSENTKRGLKQKLRRGEWPGWAPVGYFNDLKTHTVVLDPDKYKLIKKLFELYATGKYSAKQLIEKAKQMSLKGKTGKDLSKSEVEHILKNPFYYGVFRYKGEIYEASHPPIITKHLFDRVQQVFEERSNPTREKTHNFVFRGFIRCGECGGMITAEIKKGRYIYYHCTKRITKCSQKFLREEELANKIIYSLVKIWLNDRTTRKILEDFKRHRSREEIRASSEILSLEEELKTIEEKIDKLLDGYLSGIIDSKEYQAKKQKLVEQKINLNQKIDDLRQGRVGWLELAKDVISTCNSIDKISKAKIFENLGQICQKAGSNFVLRDKILSFSFRKPFNFISKNTPFVPTSSGQARQENFSFSATAEGGRDEPIFLFKNSRLNQKWLRISNYVRTFAKQNYTSL